MSRKSRASRHGTVSDDPIDDLEQTLDAPRATPRTLPAYSKPKSVPSGVEDLRRWAPDRLSISPREPVRDVAGRPARTVYKATPARVRKRHAGKALPPTKTYSFVRTLSDRPTFRDVDRTIICLKRKARKQVLHALRRTGKGARSPKRRNQWSDVRC